MSFLQVDFLRDLIALVDALCKKYGIDTSETLPDPVNTDQKAMVVRLRKEVMVKLAGLAVEEEETPDTPDEPETPDEPVVPEVTYVETQDETPQPGTTYYTRSGEEGSYEYTEFTGDTFDAQTTYYVVDNSGSEEETPETPETPTVPEVTYVETQDETPQPGTTYYTRSGEEGSYEYTEFTGESFDSQTTYYVVDTSGTE